jgi:hypothetical protein
VESAFACFPICLKCNRNPDILSIPLKYLFDREIRQLSTDFIKSRDSGTTAMLLGSAIAGLGVARRYLKR